MATKADFAQKLLHDLRLRKERMAKANAHNSDMNGNSRHNIKGSRETRMVETVSSSKNAGPKVRSKYRGSGNSQTSTAIVQAANQLVPYGRTCHQSGKIADPSMALSYAFDNRGKLKRLDIASNSAMINVVQQLGRKSMQQSLEIQWKSKRQFPTLTNLHIEEIAKGTQRLNEILRACSSGININNGYKDIGKELWKGAKELEKSLRMLVSLQEASENTMSQQCKSQIKLLDDNGDSEDESTTHRLEKQKKIELPVFSFDKNHKNSKAPPSLQPLSHPENPNPKTVWHDPINSKTSISHRCSATCGSKLQTSQLNTSSNSKHSAARLPHVIAKLMGLEEPPQHMNPKVARLATESPLSQESQQRSAEPNSIYTTQRSFKKVDSKTEYNKNAKIQSNQIRAQNNKITTLTSHKVERQDAYKNDHKTTSDLNILRMTEENREGMKNNVKESKAAIFKINKLKCQITHQNQDEESQKGFRKEAKIRSTEREQQADTTETLHTMGTADNQFPPIKKIIQADTLGHANNHETQKVAEERKPLLPQKKQNQEYQPTNMPCEPQGKKLKAENKRQQKEIQKSELTKREHNAEMVQSSKTAPRDLNNLQKQLSTKQPGAGKKRGEDIVFAGTKPLLSNRQDENPVRDSKSTNINYRNKSSTGLKSDQSSPSTNEVSESQRTRDCARSNKDVKLTPNTTRKVVGEIKLPQASNKTKTYVEITKTVMAPRAMTRTSKPQRSTPYKLKQSKLGKINNSSAAAEADKCIQKSTENRAGNDEPRNPPAYEISQKSIDAEQMDTRNHAIRKEQSEYPKEATKFLPDGRGENTTSTVSEQQASQDVGATPQIITTKQEDCSHNSSNQQQKQQKHIKTEKQLPLTEDEMLLKQKLITSYRFLHTAEALFKLNIPISILNYASDQICEEKDSKIIQDVGNELLKRKGRQQGIIFPSINIMVSHRKNSSLDDLVRQLHKDLVILQSYGRSRKDEYDYAGHILKMLESDIYNKHPDLNSMWDLGWNEVMFPCTKIDEVISNIEQLLLDELMEEL